MSEQSTLPAKWLAAADDATKCLQLARRIAYAPRRSFAYDAELEAGVVPALAIIIALRLPAATFAGGDEV